MIHLDGPLGRQLLDIAIAQLVTQIPAHPPPRSRHPGTDSQPGRDSTFDLITARQSRLPARDQPTQQCGRTVHPPKRTAVLTR
jgi:hypothetical protein